MSLPLPHRLKNFLRLCDSRYTPRTEIVQLKEQRLELYETYWWPNSKQAVFDEEIAPYFGFLRTDFQPTFIVDAGAASGHFSVASARLYPGAHIVSFEPSLRQRTLLKRNAILNGVADRIELEPFGLWSRTDNLPFRSNGAESSFDTVSRFKGVLPFPETAPVQALDEWTERRQAPAIDLLKADVEGAELAMLEGARKTLERYHPELLIQAYHIVDGTRTFERCEQLLKSLGYQISEPHPGLLHGVFQSVAAGSAGQV